MTCLTCANLQSTDKSMVKHGFGDCKHHLRGEYVSINQPKCIKYVPASAESIEKRIEWRDKTK
jgi:hypothetical protein